jgi:hypothetical protein
MSVQLRLFPLMKPLVERLGQEFFRSAPRSPGVYVMRGAREQILYIGQSKNLRVRLAFYKNANPDRIPRRLIRLVHEVETISWECQPSPEAARARELELLRLHRPRFNRADTAPQFFHFVQWNGTGDGVTIELLLQEPPEIVGNFRGPVRGKLIPFQALAAFQRLTMTGARQFVRCAELPMLPKRLSTLTVSAHPEQTLEFLEGNSPDVVTTLLSAVNSGCELALRQLLEIDAEILLAWFRALAEADKEFAA